MNKVLHLNRYYHDANKKISKKRFSMHAKRATEHSNFDKSDRCTGHVPKKRCHDVMALNEVPLGKQFIILGLQLVILIIIYFLHQAEQLNFADNKNLTAHASYANEQDVRAKDIRRQAAEHKPPESTSEYA